MNPITVRKDHLIDTITENRKLHRATFLQAQQKFRERVIEALDQRLADARAGKQVELFIRLPEPVDYTDAYDRALDMLAWEVNDQVELDEHAFAELVRNEWSWAKQWAGSTQVYTDGALSS